MRHLDRLGVSLDFRKGFSSERAAMHWHTKECWVTIHSSGPEPRGLGDVVSGLEWDVGV